MGFQEGDIVEIIEVFQNPPREVVVGPYIVVKRYPRNLYRIRKGVLQPPRIVHGIFLRLKNGSTNLPGHQ